MSTGKDMRSITQACGDPGYMACHISVYVWKIVPLFLLIFGTCGNLLTIAVLTRRRMRKSSTTVYLLFLAFSDLAFLWTNLLRRTIDAIFEIDLKLVSIFFCKAVPWLSFTAGGFSIWLLVLLTFERALFTRFPVFAKKTMTRKLAVINSLSVMICFAVLTSHFLYGKTYEAVESKLNTTFSTPAAYVKPTYKCGSIDTEYANFSYKVWQFIVFVVINLVPLVLIFSGNMLICISLRRKRRIQHNPEVPVANRRIEKIARATRMTIFLSIFFMVAVTPTFVYLTVSSVITERLNDEQFANLQLAYSVFTVLLWCNSTFNFVLYFISGSLFKEEWKKMIAEARTMLPRFFTVRTEVATAAPGTAERAL